MKAVKATITAAVMVAVLGFSAGAFAGQVAQRQNDNAQFFVSKHSPMMQHEKCYKHCKRHHFHVGRHHFVTHDTKKMTTPAAAQSH